MSYKKDADDPRESPGFELMERLLKKGAIVDYNDPHSPVLPHMRRRPDLRMESRELTEHYLRSRDCVLIVTEHSAYDWPSIMAHSRLDVELRNATRGVAKSRIELPGLKQAICPSALTLRSPTDQRLERCEFSVEADIAIIMAGRHHPRRPGVRLSECLSSRSLFWGPVHDP
jgi:hypothetical protein